MLWEWGSTGLWAPFACLTERRPITWLAERIMITHHTVWFIFPCTSPLCAWQPAPIWMQIAANLWCVLSDLCAGLYDRWMQPRDLLKIRLRKACCKEGALTVISRQMNFVCDLFRESVEIQESLVLSVLQARRWVQPPIIEPILLFPLTPVLTSPPLLLSVLSFIPPPSTLPTHCLLIVHTEIQILLL